MIHGCWRVRKAARSGAPVPASRSLLLARQRTREFRQRTRESMDLPRGPTTEIRRSAELPRGSSDLPRGSANEIRGSTDLIRGSANEIGESVDLPRGSAAEILRSADLQLGASHRQAGSTHWPRGSGDRRLFARSLQVESDSLRQTEPSPIRMRQARCRLPVSGDGLAAISGTIGRP
jgi:hypothetical protein